MVNPPVQDITGGIYDWCYENMVAEKKPANPAKTGPAKTGVDSLP